MDSYYYSVVYSAVCLFLPFYFLTNHLLNKIRSQPPTPFLSFPLIGHLYLLRKPIHHALSRISSLHGPITLLHFGSTPVLCVSSPSIAEQCLSKNDIIFANRPRSLFSKHIAYNSRSIVWAPYGDHWRTLRRIATVELLSTIRLQASSSIRSEEVKSTVLRVMRQSHASPDGTVDMNVVLFDLMLNVMMRMIAGKRYYGESREEVEEAKQFRQIVMDTFDLAQSSNIVDFMPWVGWIGLGRGLVKKMVELQRRREKFMKDLMEDHKRKVELESVDLGSECNAINQKPRTMIEILTSLQEREPETYKLGMVELIPGFPLALLSAGTDTSVNTLEWALSLLLNNPHVLQKAQLELDEKIGHDRMVEESDLPNLPYLHSIIKETLRMYPAGPLLVPHASSEECVVNSFRIPNGTTLLVNLYAIQRDPKLWEDPEEFKPERFEGFEGVKDGFKLFPFGSGRRSCPGEGLAMRMVGLALGSLVQCFQWERVGEELVDMTQGSALTLPRARHLVARCPTRANMVSVLQKL